ncbi:non-heme iron oxygenase ferredoxin subunit [Pigmentiphaga litoralis]|uniref:non-heme iron oxygenase ferredoxin subunit n=1 Tax=Pigmentiphaga litoralis TaxID=516702 RepID=UPI003B42891B
MLSDAGSDHDKDRGGSAGLGTDHDTSRGSILDAPVADGSDGDSPPGAGWHRVGPRDDCFADAPCMQATVNGVKVGLFLVDDAVYAIDDLCTHGHAMLTDGELDGFEVECPLHGGVFDVRSGKPMCSPVTRPVRTHPVRFYQGGVYVKVEG